jgi:hypothetical protein
MAAPPKKKSVDEIWRELNAKPAVPRSRTTGVQGFGIPGVTTHTRILPKAQPSGAQHAEHTAGDDASCSRDSHRPAGTSSSYDPAAAGVAPEELQQYVSTLQRTLNCLADPDRGVRKNAAAALHAKLLRGDAATPKASTNMLQVGCNSTHYIKVHMQRLNDVQFACGCCACVFSCATGLYVQAGVQPMLLPLSKGASISHTTSVSCRHR